MSNDWQTVGPRSRTSGGWGSGLGASAFGSSRAGGAFRADDTSEFAARRRAHEAANAEAESTIRYREQKAKREAEERARAAVAAATAFDSEASYPTLGGGAAASKPATTLQFKRTVAELKAREEAAELAQLAATAEQREKESWDFMPQGLRQRRFIANRCYDDGPEDYDGPEEDDGEGGDALNNAFYEEDAGASDAEPAEGEFNAELATTRRRGDHGVW